MGKFIAVQNDRVMFDPNMAPAIVQVPPGILQGSANVKVGKQAVIVSTDGATLSVNAPYSNAAFAGGIGGIRLEPFLPTNLTQKVKLNKKQILLGVGSLQNKLTVQAPANQPPPPSPVPDATPFYLSADPVVTANTTVKAS